MDEDAPREAPSRQNDPLATVLATHSEATAAETRAYLSEQTRLARLQSENLIEQNAFEISHLRWRRFNDWMRSGWQTGLAVLAGVAVIVVATVVWNASRADGLVVDAFTVPPDFEKRGIGGDVIAADMTNRL